MTTGKTDRGKEPTGELFGGLRQALEDAEHRNVAAHLICGLLWACYPEWYEGMKDELWQSKHPDDRLAASGAGR
jgi:hypothetical protein